MIFGAVLKIGENEIQIGHRRWEVSVYRFFSDRDLRESVLAQVPRKVSVWFQPDLASELQVWHGLGLALRFKSISSPMVNRLAELLSVAGIEVTAIYSGGRIFPLCLYRRRVSAAVPVIWLGVLVFVVGIQYGSRMGQQQLLSVAGWLAHQPFEGSRTTEESEPNSAIAGLGSWILGLPEPIAQIEIRPEKAVFTGVIQGDSREVMEAKLHQLPDRISVADVQTIPRGENQLEYSVILQTTH